MKHYNAAVWLIVIIAFYLQTNVFCMEVCPQSMSLFIQNYFKKCGEVNQSFNQTFTSFIKTVSKESAPSIKNELQLVLQQYSIGLAQQKENVFSAVKKNYNIRDDYWAKYTQAIQLIQKMHEQELLNSWEDAVNDPTIPQWFTAMLNHQLKSVNINPKCIMIHDVEQLGETVHMLQY